MTNDDPPIIFNERRDEFDPEACAAFDPNDPAGCPHRIRRPCWLAEEGRRMRLVASRGVVRVRGRKRPRLRPERKRRYPRPKPTR